MNTRQNQRNIAARSVEDIRSAALQARAEYIAGIIHGAWRGLQKAGQWLAQRATPAVSRSKGQSLYRCPECPVH